MKYEIHRSRATARDGGMGACISRKHVVTAPESQPPARTRAQESPQPSARQPLYTRIGHSNPRHVRDEWRRLLDAQEPLPERARNAALDAAILRGGSESFQSSRTILSCLQDGLKAAGLPEASVQAPPTTNREAVGALLRMIDFVDVIVPRGGKSLIERVQTESRIPVFSHLEGLCHTYVHAEADPQMARDIVLNAKMRRTGICGATETVLIDRDIAGDLLGSIVDDLTDAGCEVRGDSDAQRIDDRIVPASDADWDTEYLDAIVAVRVVDGVEAAIDHVNVHGSNHTDAIVTANEGIAERFLNRVDSGIVLHNASTQFADGGEFGMGAEIGISTGKMHARGPVGAEQLTSYKYVVRGAGQVRP